MTTPLRIPAVLTFTVVGAAVAAATGSCGDDLKPKLDAATCVYCVYTTADNGNCPFPTCATGEHQDVCPEGCMPQPVG